MQRWPYIAAAGAIALTGCTSPTSEPPAGEARSVRVVPFEVEDPAQAPVGRAFAESLVVRLSPADLRVSLADDTSPADSETTIRIAGSLSREGGAVHARVQLQHVASDLVAFETELSSDAGSLQTLASGVARRVADALDVDFPDLYGDIDDLVAGPEMAASPLWSNARNWRDFATDARLEKTSALVDRFGDDPAAQVLDAWALMLAWDANPSSESRLLRLRERLDALDRLDPQSPYDELVRAYVYRSSGEPDHALELYTRVLARENLANTARAWALRQRSLTQLQVGNAAAARRDAEEAVALDPVNALNRIALSKSLETLGEFDEATDVARRALLLEPQQWRHHQRLGIALMRADRFDEATESIERACRMSESQEACANLAVTLERAGRNAEARSAAEYAESLSATPFGYYNLACYRALAGMKKAALAALRRSLELGFADILLLTDDDLASLRTDSAFEAITEELESRIDVRRELSGSVFPWQA